MTADSARTPSGHPGWPEKMITQAEAFAKAAHWPVIASVSAEGADDLSAPDINLVCGECLRSMGQLRRGHVVYNGTLDEILSMVLRHMVMAHDVPLNTRAPAGAGQGRIPGPAVTPEQHARSWHGRHGGEHRLPGTGWPDDQSPIRIMTEGIEP